MTTQTQDPLQTLWGFLPDTDDQQQSMNRDAFNDISQVYLDFIHAHKTEEPKSTHWLCDAAPGHGKTTALECMLKSLNHSKDATPALIVFNNTDTMRAFYHTLHEYGEINQIPGFIQKVEASNVQEVQENLKGYLYVCITQQRFCHLALGYGDWKAYESYQPVQSTEQEKFSKLFHTPSIAKARMIIVDEMPILFNESVFDVAGDNIASDWFDELAQESGLSPVDRQLGRNLITAMVAFQLITNETFVTTSFLEQSFFTPELKECFLSILNKLHTTNASPDTLQRFKWFKRLLSENSVGCIDRHHTGSVILCSEKIDYRELGNILILDGTSQYTGTVYNNAYEEVHVTNRHHYFERLYLHLRRLTTSAEARKRKEKDVQATVADDIRRIRDAGIDPFPLVGKSDIRVYKKNGVIKDEYAPFYDPKVDDDSDMPLNLLNTTGKNVLRDFNAIALTHLPVRDPQHYKLKAIGLYGTDVNLDMNIDGETWFKDGRIEAIYRELMLSELLQIIHRSNLRSVNETDQVHIYMYHNREEWLKRLQDAVNVPVTHVTNEKVYNDELYHFRESCDYWAQRCQTYCKDQDDPFGGKTYSPGKIDRKLYQWFKDHWNRRKEAIIGIFEEYGVRIELTQKRRSGIWEEWKKVGLIE